MESLLNAGVSVSVENDTYIKLFATAVAIFVAFFLIKKVAG
jgi:hypothetical protein